ncbi:MAG: chemotaxis protein CheA, partial [Thermodesulfobacteriota bacterium]
VEQIIHARKIREKAPDIELVLKRLQAINPEEPVEAVSKIRPSRMSSSEELLLKPEESEQISGYISRGFRVYFFEFEPSPILAERGINVNTLRSRFSEVGQLIHASPRLKESGGILFQFLVATQADEALFKSWNADGVDFRLFAGPAEAPGVVEAKPADSSLPTGIPGMGIPTSTLVRVDLSRLDDLMRMIGELVLSRSRLEEHVKRLRPRLPSKDLDPLEETNQSIERQLRDLREGVMRVRMVPISEIFARMQFVVRDLAQECGKKVRIELFGQETEVDKLLVERMMDPLLHLVRNAVSHGLESPEERTAANKSEEGKIILRASTAGELVVVEVEDDGKGLNYEKIKARAEALGLPWVEKGSGSQALLEILCMPGFSTREEADLGSGRGVGLAVVRDAVQDLGGSIDVQSEVGKGTCFTIRLPLTLAIADAFITAVEGRLFAVPQALVNEVIEFQETNVVRMENNELILYRGNALTLKRLSRLLGVSALPREIRYALVLGNGQGRMGIVVDRVINRREIVIRAVTDPLVLVPGITGATELGDGRVILILDPGKMIRGTN